MRRIILWKTRVYPILLVAFIMLAPGNARAEKIYCKNGKVLDVQIIYLTKKSIWYKTSLGSAGISIDSINKIENGDGSLSKYDYKNISSQIQEFIKQKDFNQALTYCAILLEYFPEDFQLHYLRGVLAQKVNNPELAEEEYGFLIKHKRADAKILNNLGVIYASRQKNEEARDLFIKVQKQDPLIKEASVNLATLFMNLNDYPRAIQAYQQVLNSDPGNAKALYNQGMAWYKSKDYAQARTNWTKMLDFEPDNKEAINALEFLKTSKLPD
jgi:Flp pilus assembly protein TadD